MITPAEAIAMHRGVYEAHMQKALRDLAEMLRKHHYTEAEIREAVASYREELLVELDTQTETLREELDAFARGAEPRRVH